MVHTVADPGFLEGGFYYIVAREFLEATPTFGAKPRPLPIVFEIIYQLYQSNRSVFERISSKAF